MMQQLDADQQHADAHARLQRNRVNRERLPAQARERRARIGERVDADAEPRHPVAAGDADQAEQQDDRQVTAIGLPGIGVSQPK